MSLNFKIVLLLIAMLLCRSVAIAQSIEYYAGNKRTGVDLMWFKNFKKFNDDKSSFLFFSRNRASVDYHNSPTTFGSTNAISYNFKNGIGLVGVVSFLNNGITPKAGIQYNKQKDNFIFFGWLVGDLKKDGNIDLFGLFRYQPKINKNWRTFGQLELFPIYNTNNNFWNITQRFRLGIKYQSIAFGFMADLNQSGKNDFSIAENYGGFLRYEF